MQNQWSTEKGDSGLMDSMPEMYPYVYTYKVNTKVNRKSK